MARADGSSSRLDEYLNTLASLLHRLPEDEVAEIRAELRCHALDRAADRGELSEPGVVGALQRLGSAQELAEGYLTESLMARAGRSRSPWLMFQGLWRWARLSVAGAFALLGLVVGYTVAVSFAIAALVKPFLPGSAGLWRLEDGSFSLHLGFGSPPPGGRELLGWWLVPLGLLLGSASVWVTMRFGRWCIRRYRPRPPAMAR